MMKQPEESLDLILDDQFLNRFKTLNEPELTRELSRFARLLYAPSQQSRTNPFQNSLSNHTKMNYFYVVNLVIGRYGELLDQINKLEKLFSRMDSAKDYFLPDDMSQKIWSVFGEKIIFDQEMKILSETKNERALFTIDGVNITVNDQLNQAYQGLSKTQAVTFTVKITQWLREWTSKIIEQSLRMIDQNTQRSCLMISAVTQNAFDADAGEHWLLALRGVSKLNWSPDAYKLFLRIALDCSDAELSYQLVQVANIRPTVDNINKLSSLCVTQDHPGLFRWLIRSHIMLDFTQLSTAKTPNIQKILSYRPGVGVVSVLEELKITSNSNDVATSMLDDEQDTTDEESSDEEVDHFVPIDDQGHQNNRLLYRGLHFFCGEHFKGTARKEACRPNHHQQDVLSRGTSTVATLLAASKSTAANEEHQKEADQHVKSYFSLLKLTPDKREHKSDTTLSPQRKILGANANFASLHLHLLQAYVMSYSHLFNGEGISRNFNFCCNQNPFVSTSRSAEVALKYAFGVEVLNEKKRSLRVRKSTGVLKHRRLGYVQVYSESREYFERHSADIATLNAQKIIGLSHRYSFFEEVVVESSIPKELIFGYYVVSLPKMKPQWTSEIQEQYGLTEYEYQQFRLALLNATRSSSDALRSALDSQINKILSYQLNRLTRQINDHLLKLKSRDVADLNDQMAAMSVLKK